MTQASNGKWYVYVVDDSVATLMDGDDNGIEFGFQCTDGFGVGAAITGTGVLVANSANYEVWANAMTNQAVAAITAGGCFDVDGAERTTDDTAGTTSRADMTAAVLQGSPTLSDPDGDKANLGQRGHALNASGYGSWPYIISEDLSDDNVVSYGSDSINVVYGNTDDETSIDLANRNPADQVEIHLTLTDPALNIDPTTADIWIFNLDQTSANTTVIFGNNGTNSTITPAELGEMQCSSNCQLTSDGEATLQSGGGNGVSAVAMTESGANTGVFESFDVNGAAEFETLVDASRRYKNSILVWWQQY